MATFSGNNMRPPTNDTLVYGHSRAIQDLNSIIGDVARTNIPVLLTGESGTGKEVYGRMIHRLSKNGHLPLRKVGCRVVEAGELLALLKWDLKEGATGTAQRPGTLFLDCIEELDLEGQRTLLSLLPDGENGTTTRILASTSQNLEKGIESGRFQRELYFRISGVLLRLPPLRDRKEDVHVFMEHFLAKHAAELGRQAPVLSQQERECLLMHDWPGNVRELENVARRMVLLGDARRVIEDLGESPKREAGHEEGRSFSLRVAARTASRKAERDLIAKALERTHWNRKRAAQELQISYKSLLYKIKQTGLEGKEKERG